MFSFVKLILEIYEKVACLAYRISPGIRRTRILKVDILKQRLCPLIRRNQKSVKDRG